MFRYLNLILFILTTVLAVQIVSADTIYSPRCSIDQIKPDIIPAAKHYTAAPFIKTGSGIRPPDMDWVNSTLAGMSLDEKLGQMVLQWYSSDSADYEVETLKVGGLIFSVRGAASVVQAVNHLQSLAGTPLWFAADFEIGTGTRIHEGTVFPMNMALGAADDEVLAASCGWVTAREAWAMGVHIGFCPVVDVNTDPENPIISTRSYGDDPELISRLAEAWISGAHQVGMLTSLKHYPGHGPTHDDSHTTLPTVTLSEDELRKIHIKPYENLIKNGYSDMVMTAHVWYSALDPEPWPATLSEKAMTDILRNDLGFTGIAISDAFNMAGLGSVLPQDEAAVVGIKNGLDIILMPPDTEDTINALKEAVNLGEITESRIDESVRRILMAKSSMWLPEYIYRDETEMWNVLNQPEHFAVAEAVARASITKVTETEGVLPLLPEQDILCLPLDYSKSIFVRPDYNYFTNRLAADLPNLNIQEVDLSLSESNINQIVTSAANYDRVVVAGYNWVPITSDDQIELVQRLIASDTPVIYISFGSPYHGLQINGLENYFCAYACVDVSQWAGADVLLGKLEPEGILPISNYDILSSLWILY